MMRVDELVATIPSLQRSDLEAWIRDALVAPVAETLRFSEMECARVRLICTLHYELEIGADTLPVVLSLVDQLYANFDAMNAVLEDKTVLARAEATGKMPPNQRFVALADALGYTQFFAQRGNRLHPQRWRGGGNIDQVAVVRDDRLNAGLLDTSSEADHFVARQFPRAPLSGGLGEDLQGVAARGVSTINRPRQPAGDRHVGSETRHLRNAEC